MPITEKDIQRLQGSGVSVKRPPKKKAPVKKKSTPQPPQQDKQAAEALKVIAEAAVISAETKEAVQRQNDLLQSLLMQASEKKASGPMTFTIERDGRGLIKTIKLKKG